MVIIRKATENDIPRILELYSELAEEKINLSPAKAQRIFNEISSMPNHEFFVGEQDNLVVGTVYLQIVPNLTHDGKPWAIIENVVVDSRFRGKGIGHSLMEAALACCRAAGCCRVQLLSNKKRVEAHKFYRSLQFEESALGFRLYL